MIDYLVDTKHEVTISSEICKNKSLKKWIQREKIKGIFRVCNEYFIVVYSLLFYSWQLILLLGALSLTSSGSIMQKGMP